MVNSAGQTRLRSFKLRTLVAEERKKEAEGYSFYCPGSVVFEKIFY
jgi:hypothetical protein